MIFISFEFQTKYGKYSDTLLFSEEEYKFLSEEQIQFMKQKRLNNWIQFIENCSFNLGSEEETPSLLKNQS